MAFSPDDPALLKDPNNPNGQQQLSGQGAQGLGGQGAVQNTGGSGQDPFAGQSGVSTAGVGSGGTGGWTNIQAYLNANKGNTGSSDALSKQVGQAFDQEDQTFKDQSGQARQQAQGEVDRSNLGTDQASKLVSQAANLYSYSPNQNADANLGGGDPYKAIIDQFQNARKAYSGPSSFSYNSPTYSKVQDYGSNLGTDQGFGALMQGIYNSSAGGRLTSGQQALQTQLDSNNPLLSQARQSLLDRYSGLTGSINQGAQDTDQFVKNAAGQVGSNQSALDQYLSGEATKDRDSLTHKADAANIHANDFATKLSQELSRLTDYKYNPTDSNDGRDPIHVGVHPQVQANDQNITGADQERNSWNVIQDIFGRPEQKIGHADQMYSLNNPQFSVDDYPAEALNGVHSFQDMVNQDGFKELFDRGLLNKNYFDDATSPLSDVQGGFVPRRI
jgi:hypothetical protein